MRTIAGLLLVTSLTLGSGCAKTDWIDRTLVTENVTGTWYGTAGGTQGAFMLGDFFLDLDQQGQVVKGTLRVRDAQGDLSGPIEGTVAGDVFRFKSARGNVGGELTISGDDMTGVTTTTTGSRPLSLRRVNPSSPSVSPPR